MAAWAQAIVSSVAIVAGALVVYWQTRRTRQEQNEREARMLDGLVLFLIHLKECAQEARAVKKQIERLPIGHPAEPSARFHQLVETIHRFPLEAVRGAVPMDALLTSRRIGNELVPYIDPEPELDVNLHHEKFFNEYIVILDRQVISLQEEAHRLRHGKHA